MPVELRSLRGLHYDLLGMLETYGSYDLQRGAMEVLQPPVEVWILITGIPQHYGETLLTYDVGPGNDNIQLDVALRHSITELEIILWSLSTFSNQFSS